MSPRLPTAFNSCFEGRNGRRGTDAFPPRGCPKLLICFLRKERTAGGGGTDASPRLSKAFNCFVRKERNGRPEEGDRCVPEASQSPALPCPALPCPVGTP